MLSGMFCLMALGVVWLIAGRGEAQGRFDDTAKLLYSGIDSKQPTRAVTADMVGMCHIYAQVQMINPDSLGLQDSTFLHDIDKQLNHIIHE